MNTGAAIADQEHARCRCDIELQQRDATARYAAARAILERRLASRARLRCREQNPPSGVVLPRRRLAHQRSRGNPPRRN